MKSAWPETPRIGIPRNDPRFTFKKSLLAALPAEVVALEAAPGPLALVDLSGTSEKGTPVFENKWLGLMTENARILAPAFSDKTKWGKIPQRFKSRVGECHPLLCWRIAERIATIRENKISGQLISFRLIWNLPADSKIKNNFEDSLLPELLLLSETMAGSGIKKIHLEASKTKPLVFGLLTFQNGVVGEWDVNAVLPRTMEPLRFLHAYFSEGAVTNLPLSGYVNTGGSILATSKKLSRPVFESGDFEGGDEMDNAFGFLVRDLLSGKPPIPVGTGLEKRRQILSVLRRQP